MAPCAGGLSISSLSRPDGIGINEIAALVYADRPNDEPNWAANSLKTCVWWANKQLRPQGYQIKSSMGPGAVYRLEKFPPQGDETDWQTMWTAPYAYPERL